MRPTLSYLASGDDYDTARIIFTRRTAPNTLKSRVSYNLYLLDNDEASMAPGQKLYPRATVKKIVKAHSNCNVSKNVDVTVG